MSTVARRSPPVTAHGALRLNSKRANHLDRFGSTQDNAAAFVRFVLAFIGSCPRVNVLAFVFEHMIDNPRDFAGGSNNGFGCADGLSGKAKSMGRAVGGLARCAAQDLAARDVVVCGRRSHEVKCWSATRARTTGQYTAG